MTPEIHFAQGYAAAEEHLNIEDALQDTSRRILFAEEQEEAIWWLDNQVEVVKNQYIRSLLQEAREAAGDKVPVDYLKGLAKGLRERQSDEYDPVYAKQKLTLTICLLAKEMVDKFPPLAKDKLILKDVGACITRASDLI